MAYPSDYVFRGAVIYYSVNTEYQGYWNDVMNHVRSGISGNYLPRTIDGNYQTGNITLTAVSISDRNSINDIKSDFDNWIRSGPGVKSIRSSMIRFISNPRRDNQPQPGTIPGAAGNVDTTGQGSTVLGTAGQFWLDQLGQQVQGLVQGIASGGPMMWVGIGVVALIIFSRK